MRQEKFKKQTGTLTKCFALGAMVLTVGIFSASQKAYVLSAVDAKKAIQEQIQQRKQDINRKNQLTDAEKHQLRQKNLGNRIFVRGKAINSDVEPFIENGRTLVPVRVISEDLGATVLWNPQKMEVSIQREGRTIQMFIDNQEVNVNSQTMQLEVPPKIVNGRTFVPLRFVSEALNEYVEYNPETGEIDIALEKSEDVITFKDKTLEELIRKEIQKPNGAILSHDVENITELRISGATWDSSQVKINDLSGLEALTNLTTLVLSSINLSDISALKSLTNLKELTLMDNNISDISALQGLTKLSFLSLFEPNLSDFSHLKGLTNLKTLYFGRTNLSDFSFLQGLTKLESLQLRSNNLSDISYLKDLTNLKELTLMDNNISDISYLKGLTNLTNLSLSSNNISDISALKDLTNLTYLNLSSLAFGGSNITDISALKGLTNLSSLSLGGSNISDISALKGLTNLTYLYLTGNKISDISALKGLTNLRSLELAGNNISDISALKGLTNSISYLDLQGNNITDISILDGLTQSQSKPFIFGKPISAH